MLTEEKRRELLEKANTLPLCPGVYIMKDKGGNVIYVGKSRKLKNRVSQYFQNSEKNIKTSRMVSMVNAFEHFLCDTEMEALSLENALIKQYTPKYNIRLKDAKSYPYIKLTNEIYPRLIVTRKREEDKAKYFGPYSGVATAYALVDFINKTLQLPSCRHALGEKTFRPCINYQMHRCCGPCTGNIDRNAYLDKLSYVQGLLTGKQDSIQKELSKQMIQYAEEEKYEAAAQLRDTIKAMEKIKEKQKVIAGSDVDEDVIAMYTEELCSSISVFHIRSGILQDKKELVFGAESILEVEDMTTVLCDYYKLSTDIPQKILLDFSMSEEDVCLLSEYLTKIASHKVQVHIPVRGENKALCEMVEKNAKEAAEQFKQESEKKEGVLIKLAEILQLDTIPERIESYDISNFGQEHLTAGMIVWKDGKFQKSDYRYFRIKDVEGTNDYASMREALTRRLSHLSDTERTSFTEMPDLILLDGGKGHVHVIKELLQELSLPIPVFGMVKDDYHKTRSLCTDTEEISIARYQDVFHFLYKMQEEVHRFTITKMEEAKNKSMKTSVLTEIKGVGEKKAKMLLHTFGGLEKVRKASIEELMNVKGISEKDALQIIQYFQKL